jgi:hypothetical protein
MFEVLVNGKFATLDERMRSPEAVVVSDGRIGFTGSRADALAFVGVQPHRFTDLGGRTVIPGLIDMHAHLDREGLKQMHPPMTGLRSRHDVLNRIAALAQAAAPGSWIVTMPLGEPPFYFFHDTEAEAAFYPSRQELDEAAPNNPVYIRPIVGFWRWSPGPETLISAANSAALRAVDLTNAASVPAASVTFERDGAGQLTGRFFEKTSVSLVELLYFARVVRYGAGDRVAGLRLSQAAALACGVTTVFEGHGVEPDVAEAYKTLHGKGELAIRAELVYSPAWSHRPLERPAQIVERSLGWLGGKGWGDDRLRLRGLFINPLLLADDAARAGAGYTGLAGYNFDSGLTEDGVLQVLRAVGRHDIRAVGLTPQLFDFYNQVATEIDIRDRGWLIQHCGHLPPERQAIASDRGIGLTFLPVEAMYKQAYLAHQKPALRRDWMPLRRLLDAGQPISLASDNIPVSLFFAIWCCLARRDRRGRELPDPDGPISREEALGIATLEAARCLGRADTLGSLEPGKRADLAVLDRDYFGCLLDEIPEIQSVATMVDGAWRHVTAHAPPGLVVSSGKGPA